MARLIYVKEIQNSNLLRLGISEGEESSAYTVRMRVYAEIGKLTKGSEIAAGAMELILAEDEYVRCKKRALYLLSIADNNERGLYAKLRAKGFSHEIAIDVCREMTSLGYINECEQLERLILKEANERLVGARKISLKLAAKGYGIDKIRDTMQRLSDSGKVDFSANARTLVQKKLGENPSDEEKNILLVKHGYRK